MRRERLRPMPDATELARMYAKPHDHRLYPDHQPRVDAAIRLGAQVYPRTVADLSCGNAAIATALREQLGAELYLGDLAPGYAYRGPIEETIQQIPHVDLFVCCETIEHLDDPDKVLRAIRDKADHLILSTPDGEFDQGNPQHVWGWDGEAVQQMLIDAGFTPDIHESVDMRPQRWLYCFQVWAAS